MKFVVKHFRSGEHVVASVFTELRDKTQALLGTLRMDEKAWERFGEVLSRGPDDDSPLGTVVHFEEK